MKSFETTRSSAVEIISAYSTQNQLVSAQDAEEAYFVIGSFFLPLNVEARLEVVGLVSSGQSMTVRVYDVTALAAVGNMNVTVVSESEARKVSGVISLTGGHIYQFQAQVLGVDGYGIVREAQLI